MKKSKRRYEFRWTFKLSDGTTSIAYGYSRLSAVRVLYKRVSRKVLILSVEKGHR